MALSALRVTSEDAQGRAYDLSHRAEDLSYSSVRPGGDEKCSFQIAASWQNANPEITRGNLLRVSDGIDVLWSGRIEEHERGGGDAETIEVTGYGLGARLKDQRSLSMIYVLRLMNELTDRTADELTISGETAASASIETDAGARPAWDMVFADTASATVVYLVLDATDRGGAIYAVYSRTSVLHQSAAAEIHFFQAFPDNVGTPIGLDVALETQSSDYSGARIIPGDPRPYLVLRGVGGPSTVPSPHLYWADLAIYGSHGMPFQGPAPAGYYPEQIIEHLLGQVDGIVPGQIDRAGHVIEHFSIDRDTFEAHVNALNNLLGFDWGTWASRQVFDRSDDGFFDFTAPRYDALWSVPRSECEDLGFHSELATLFNNVDITWTDVAGASQTERRTRVIPELDDHDIERVATLSGPTMTTASAQTLGDTFLALTGGFAPARGQTKLTRPVHHRHRGYLPPWHMRADGSNIRITDILPTTSMFALDEAPDRRAIFPIKRVAVSAAGKVPEVTLELDQTNDLLSILQARLAQAAEVTLG